MSPCFFPTLNDATPSFLLKLDAGLHTESGKRVSVQIIDLHAHALCCESCQPAEQLKSYHDRELLPGLYVSWAWVLFLVNDVDWLRFGNKLFCLWLHPSRLHYICVTLRISQTHFRQSLRLQHCLCSSGASEAAFTWFLTCLLLTTNDARLRRGLESSWRMSRMSW